MLLQKPFRRVARVSVVEGYVRMVRIEGKPKHAAAIRRIILPLTLSRPMSQVAFERTVNLLAFSPADFED